MKTLAFGAVFCLAVGVAQAQLIVGNDQSGTATIWNVDPVSGAATALYSASDSSAKPWGMAYDGASNTLYWNNGGTLYKSAFGPTLSPVALGSMTFNGGSVNFVGLTFHNGRLYGTRNIATEAVYSINIDTLTASQEYVYPSTFDFGGLEADPVSGILYGLSDSGGAGLYKIDLNAPSTSFVAGYPAGETDIDGLAVFNDIAYYVTDGPNTSQPNFYRVDVMTGAILGTLPSPFTGSGTFSAATYVPEPATIAALALLGVLGLRRR